MVRVVIRQIVLYLRQEQDTFNLFETSRPALQSTQPVSSPPTYAFIMCK